MTIRLNYLSNPCYHGIICFDYELFSRWLAKKLVAVGMRATRLLWEPFLIGISTTKNRRNRQTAMFQQNRFIISITWERTAICPHAMHIQWFNTIYRIDNRRYDDGGEHRYNMESWHWQYWFTYYPSIYIYYYCDYIDRLLYVVAWKWSIAPLTTHI